MKPLNLASRPFRNERLPTLLAGLLALVAVAATLLHASEAIRILPSRLGRAEGEARDLEDKLERLRSERQALVGLRPSKDDLEVWERIRGLVDQRVFGWTKLLARLNSALPSDVRLLSIEPKFSKEGVRVRLTATATTRGSPTLLGLVGTLESQPEFEDVTPDSLSETADGDKLSLELRYVPPRDTEAQS